MNNLEIEKLQDFKSKFIDLDFEIKEVHKDLTERFDGLSEMSQIFIKEMPKKHQEELEKFVEDSYANKIFNAKLLKTKKADSEE